MMLPLLVAPAKESQKLVFYFEWKARRIFNIKTNFGSRQTLGGLINENRQKR